MHSCRFFDFIKQTCGNANTFASGTLFAALLNLLTAAATASTIHVPADQPTIQQAINAATNGDIILVSPGTYFEHINYHGKAIAIQSTNGSAQTIIDGSNTGTVATFQTQEGPQSVLTGFTIQHGSASFGAGVMLTFGTSPTITRNIFRDNAQGGGGFGAAIGGNASSPVVERNMFLANTCDTQFLSGVVAFVNASSPLVINNIFKGNSCRAINMALPGGNHPVVANNTIVQNSVGIRVDARFGSGHLYANNILVGNGVGLFVDSPGGGHEPIWTNNLVFDNTTNYSGIADQTGMNGNISSNPLFISIRTFQIQRGSPAVDAGTLSVPGLPTTDFAGKPRVVDGNGDGTVLPDMGAYEAVAPNSGIPPEPGPEKL
jgi:serine protease